MYMCWFPFLDQLGGGWFYCFWKKLKLVADPDAEVIALSPKTLLATNRFVCEICNKLVWVKQSNWVTP